MKKLLRKVSKKIARRLLDHLSIELATIDDTTLRKIGGRINTWVDIPQVNEGAEARIIYNALRKTIVIVKMLLDEMD